MKWTIRRVNAANVDSVANEILDIQEAGWTSSEVLASLEGDRARVLIAEGREGDIGTILGFVISRRIVDVLEIDLVAVRPSSRRFGIARALLSRMLSEETRSGALEVRLELAGTNDGARLLYESLGFVVVGRRTRYYPDGDDALLLSRLKFTP